MVAASTVKAYYSAALPLIHGPNLAYRAISFSLRDTPLVQKFGNWGVVAVLTAAPLLPMERLAGQ